MGIFEIFDWIYSFKDETKVCLQELNSDLKRDVNIKKVDRGFFLKLDYNYFKLTYNKKSNFIVSHNSFKIKVNHYLIRSHLHYLENIEAYIFQSLSFNENAEKFHCYFSKTDDSFLISFFEGSLIRDFQINIDNFKFNISTCQISEKIGHTFLLIECKNKINFNKFKHYVNNIISSIAFFSGKFYKNEEFYFQSKFEDFSKNTEIFYRSSEKKYSFPKPFTKFPNEWNWKIPEDFKIVDNLSEKYSSNINKIIFCNLVELNIAKPKIYFSLRMFLFYFYDYSQISRVAMMFVILETICEEFNKDLNKDLNTEFIKKNNKKEFGINTLSRIKDKIDVEDFEILKDIVENTDIKLTNNFINFEKTFSGLKIILSNYDKAIFKNRNDFFHGRIIPNPTIIDCEEDFNNLEMKYDYIAYRLYVLISKLILKKIGYNGYLINYPKLFEDYNEMNLKEPYFIELK